MITAYLDASAILKLTLAERESLALIEYVGERDIRVATSVIAEVEVLRSLQRKSAGMEDQGDAIRGIYLLNLDSDVRREAIRLASPNLRALDAIHVATAASIGARDLEFITYDDRMAAAARAAGLKVVQPGCDQKPTV
ncbi:MAG TPA: type II toxin-antitoxin system VapC family toxin [Vicinamibacterales bacterium]|nr:type II toxin-antitoxin system VapC family toxin [Vicinamibacterales bacterium]